MQYRVITVAREFGSGGAEIARQLAERLGWNLLDNALVQQVAQSAEIDPELARRLDERVDTWLQRVAQQGLWGGAFEGIAPPAGVPSFDADNMASITKGLIEQAYKQGNC